MARVGRAIAWIAAAALLLAAVAITAVWITASSDRGRRLIERALARASGGQIIAAGLAGHFPEDLRLAHLELRDRQGAWAEADNLRLQWSPGALVHGRVRIELLQIGQVQIARAPLSTAASGSSRQVGSFWAHIDLLRLEVPRLGLGAPLTGTPVAMQVIGSGQLRSLQDASVVLAVDRLDAPGRYHLSAQFDAAQMTAVLQLAEPAGGPLANLLQLPALGALSAQLRLQGPRNAEVLDATVAAGPLRAMASGSLNLKQQSADLAISITAPSMAPRANLSWESASLQGRWQGTLAAAMTSAHLEIARLVAAGASASSISADLRGERGALQLTGLLRGVRLPGPQPELLAAAPIAVRATANLATATRAVTFTISHPLASVRGSAGLGADRSLLLTATVPTLKPLAALAGVDLDGRGSVDLRAAMRNTAAAPLRLDLDATVDAAPGASPLAALLAGGAKIGVAASIVGEQVRISKAHIDSKLLHATLEGSRTAQTLEARWQLAVASLQALSPALQGRLSAQGQLSGPVRELRAEADLSGEFAIHGSTSGPMEAHLRATGLPANPAGSLDLGGTLDGAPLRLRAVAGRGANGTLRLSLERGEWRSAHAEGVMSLPANGANPQGRIAFRMSRLADLQTLLATAMQGSIAGELRFAPSGARSRGELRAEARDLAFAERHVGTVALSVAVDQLDMNSKRATVSTLQLQIQDRVLRLLAPTRFAFGDGFTVNHLRLGLQQAVLEVDGRLAPQLDLRARLSNITPQLLQAVADGRLGGAMLAAADGTLGADARLTGSTAAPRGSVHVTATGLHVRAGAASALPPADFSATANLGEGSAKIQLALSAGALLQLHANGSVPLSGQAVLDVHAGGQLNLSIANPFLEANGRRVQGQLQIDAALSGSYAAPQARGTVHLLHGALQDYARGAHLTDISASIEASGDTLRLTSFSARAGSGTVSMSGSFGALRPELPLDLALTAHNAQPLASDLLTANLDLNLSLRGQLRRHVDVAGSIRVNRADINIPTALPASVAVLDVRRPGQAARPADADSTSVNLQQLGLNLTVDAPRQVFVRGRGLDAEVGGELSITGSGALPLFNGGFDLRTGAFSLGGASLQFTSGRVSFNGTGVRDKIDPTLDFVASGNSGGITSTLTIGGYADAPTIALSSMPPMPQDEILARLLFGEGVAQLTPLQIAQIGAALASISGVGGGGLNPLATIQRKLGLDRLSVSGGSAGTDNSGTRVEAGRYVSNRIYVGTRQSTSGGTQAQVEIDLTKSLKLQTTLGTGSGSVQGATPENDPGSSVGIAYRFEY